MNRKENIIKFAEKIKDMNPIQLFTYLFGKEILITLLSSRNYSFNFEYYCEEFDVTGNCIATKRPPNGYIHVNTKYGDYQIVQTYYNSWWQESDGNIERHMPDCVEGLFSEEDNKCT